MNAKKVDKIAISTLYVIAGIIVTILAALILYILVRGIPHISWSFLTSMSSSHKAGGGIGVQLYNSLFLLVITLIISVPLSMGAGNMPKKAGSATLSVPVLKSFHHCLQWWSDSLVI